MNWTTPYFVTLACFVGLQYAVHAQVFSSGEGYLLPLTISDEAYLHGINPAMRAEMKDPYFCFSHRNLYGIKELTVNSLSTGYPLSPGTLSVNYSVSGNPLYHEYGASLSFARDFGKKIKAGIQLDYLGNRSRESENGSTAITFEGGMIATPVQNLILGFHLFNPLQINYFKRQYQQIPSLLRFATGYTPGKKVLLVVELEREINGNTVVKGLVSYSPSEKITFRTGFSSQLGQLFGFSTGIGQFHFDVSLQRHQFLGYTMLGSICWLFKPRRK